MGGNRTLATTLTAALAVETVGAVAPWSGGATLPKPSAYAATWSLWFVLGLIGSANSDAERAAGQLSLLVLASMMVLGPGGKKLVAALNQLANLGGGSTPAGSGQVAA